MKILKLSLITLGGFMGWMAAAAAQPAPAPSDDPPVIATNAAPVIDSDEMQPADAPDGPDEPDEPAEPKVEDQAPDAPAPPIPAPDEPPPSQDSPPSAGDAPKPAAKPAAEFPGARNALAPLPAVYTTTNTPGELRLNFRNAPLELVLNYLSDAAGFIIVPETEIKGKVDAWSNQPVSKDEAVELLNTVLNKNGYALLRNGRTLTIVGRDEARRRDIPVRSGNDPALIPRTDEMVTQIIPVRYISAAQLVRNLQPLLSSTDALTANEAGNALVLTDTQMNVRRMVEIIKAIDTALSTVSTVKVFPLKFADAKSLVTVIKELFQPQQTGSSGGNSQGGGGRLFNFMRGGGGGPPGFGGGGDQGGSGGGRAPAPKVLAVADERSNALVVSAPEEQMPIIEDLVAQVDADVEDITELRVFRLKFADAQEMADLLANLFPDPTTSSSQNRRGQISFGGGPFGGMRIGGNNRGAGDQSARLQQQQKVTAVPDLRTRSVVVSAARALMPQIASMIQELDADPAMKQKVYVFSVENTDPETVQGIIEDLFPEQNYGTQRSSSRRNTSSQQAGNQLNNRARTSQNQSSGIGRSSGSTPRFGTGQ